MNEESLVHSPQKSDYKLIIEVIVIYESSPMQIMKVDLIRIGKEWGIALLMKCYWAKSCPANKVQ